MKTVKKTSEYTIFQRRDDRYAVVNTKKQAINGDEKVKILVEAGLLKKPTPAPKSAPDVETETAESTEENTEN